MRASTRAIILLCLFALLIAGYVALSKLGVINLLEDSVALKQWIQQLGLAGPLVIVGLMVVAIIMSPIPSAPVALVAGAAYGHSLGTLYVAIGSELGAIIAFYIARFAGTGFIRNWVDKRITKSMMGSQNALMFIIFFSRLMPFISFDMVSYAAGVTPLKFWRFAVATLAGIIPASFLLAHVGSELASAEGQRVGLTLLLLGAVSLAFFLFKWLSDKRK